MCVQNLGDVTCYEIHVHLGYALWLWIVRGEEMIRCTVRIIELSVISNHPSRLEGVFFSLLNIDIRTLFAS